MKKLKFILSVLLSLLIVFSVFPSTVYASNVTFTRDILQCWYDDPNNPDNSLLYRRTDDKSLNSSVIKQKDIVNYLILYTVNSSLSVGDELNFQCYITPQNYNDVYICSIQIYTLDNVELYYDTANFTYNKSTGLFKINYKSNFDVSDRFKFYISIKPNQKHSDSLLDFNTVNASFTIEKESTSLLNSILEWLENIRDKIVNLPSEFGSFITDLKNNVSSWFTDLKSNIDTQIKKIGRWFDDLGDNIGGFFTDLWDNISLKFETINTDISNWWQGVKDWFHSLFVPEDGWIEDYKKRIDSFLSAHLGMVYEAPRLISGIFNLILGAFNKPANGSVIIPRITFPGTSYVLIDYTEFNLNTIINSNERFKWMYDTFKIASSAILFLLVLNYCRKELDEFLKDREVSE